MVKFLLALLLLLPDLSFGSDSGIPRMDSNPPRKISDPQSVIITINNTCHENSDDESEISPRVGRCSKHSRAIFIAAIASGSAVASAAVTAAITISQNGCK